MATKTKIEWADSTLNLWWGCTEVSPACDNCYARTLANRYHKDKDLWSVNGDRMLVNWRKNLKKIAKEADGKPRTVFVQSMSDIFERPRNLVHWSGAKVTGDHFGFDDPLTQYSTATVRDQFYEEIRKYPNLIFLLLTKRIGNVYTKVPGWWWDEGKWPDNVWVGITVVNQKEADRDIPKLLELPCRKFLSMEPLQGPVDFDNMRCENCGHIGEAKWVQPTGPDDYLDGAEPYCPKCGSSSWGSMLKGIDWVIVGGESGHGARPMREDWAYMISGQCHEEGVPFHFKQWGEYLEVDWIDPVDGYLDCNDEFRKVSPRKPMTYGYQKESYFQKVGTKNSGRKLGGKEYNATPHTILNE